MVYLTQIILGFNGSGWRAIRAIYVRFLNSWRRVCVNSYKNCSTSMGIHALGGEGFAQVNGAQLGADRLSA